jgi:glucose-6-phosphate 1-dehydrogenase
MCRYNTEVPDSYEHLLLDVLDGDSHLFMQRRAGCRMERADSDNP